MRIFTVIVVLLVSPLTAWASEQRYEVDLTDYAAVKAIVALINGESLEKGLSAGPLKMNGVQVMKMLKSGDWEVLTRARPAYRSDGKVDREAKGFYLIHGYLWRQFGPLADGGLNYQVEFYGEHGSETKIHSICVINVRRFGKGDPFFYRLANVPLIHKFVNRKAAEGVLIAERTLIVGIAEVQDALRKKERQERLELKKKEREEKPPAKGWWEMLREM